MSKQLSLDDRRRCYYRLVEFYSAQEAVKWLNSPHPQLEGRVPAECPLEEVMAIIDRLGGDAYV